MGFKSLFQNLAVTHVNIMGDLADNITYNQIVLGAYDPVAGIDSSKNKKVTITALVSFIKDDQSVLNEQSNLTAEVRFPALNCPVTPQLNDTLIHNGKLYQVVIVEIDQARSMWALTVRGL